MDTVCVPPRGTVKNQICKISSFTIKLVDSSYRAKNSCHVILLNFKRAWKCSWGLYSNNYIKIFIWEQPTLSDLSWRRQGAGGLEHPWFPDCPGSPLKRIIESRVYIYSFIILDWTAACSKKLSRTINSARIPMRSHAEQPIKVSSLFGQSEASS